MHRCYPECKPEIGFHHSKSREDTAKAQLENHVRTLEKKLAKARDVSGLAPNPDNYDVLDVQEFGSYKVLLVHYPNCTNFGGKKVIVTKCEMIDLVRLKRLDPHFTEVVP